MGFFEGVSSLSELSSAGNVDALLDGVAGSDDICLFLNHNFHQMKV